MNKRLLTMLVAMVLVFTMILGPAVASAQQIDISFSDMKVLFGKLISKINELEENDPDAAAEKIILLKVFMAGGNGGIDELAAQIEAGTVFKSALQMLEQEGLTPKNVADGLRLFKIWDVETRMAYIEQFEQRDGFNPIAEEEALYEEITTKFDELEGLLQGHNVDLGTLLIAANAIKKANDYQAIFTDDAANAEDFALNAISSSVKGQVDTVLEGYSINGMEYTDFNTMANVYIDKVNARYTKDRKDELKAILGERGLYVARQSGGSDGGSTGGDVGGDPSVDENTQEAIDNADKEIDDIIGDLDNQDTGKDQKDAQDQIADLIANAVKQAAQVSVAQDSITVADGKASVALDEESLTNAIANAVKVADTLTAKAEQAGLKVKAEKVVTVVVPKQEGVKEVAATLPSNILAAAKKQAIDRIEVDAGLASIAITPDALGNAVKSTSKNIELSVAAVDKTALSEEVAAKVGNKPVFDFNLSVDGNKVSNFTGKKAVKVSFDYVLEADENADKVVVYYINDKGQFKAIRNGKYNAETGKVTFTTNHFSQYTAQQTDITFDDITNVAWAKSYIEALAGREIVDGMGNGQFNPDGKVTRAQFIKMLIYAFDLVDEDAVANFTDVEQGAWYYQAVASAQKLGITNGIGNNKFGINDNITRQDMATMAYKAAQVAQAKISKTNTAVTFADDAKIADYAAESVTAMQRAGIIDGVGGNAFAPNDNATRAQAAKIIYLLYKGM